MFTIALVGTNNVEKTSYLKKLEALVPKVGDGYMFNFENKTVQILNVDSSDKISIPIDGVIAMYTRNDKVSYFEAVTHAITIKNCVLIESNTDLPEHIVFGRLPNVSYFDAESQLIEPIQSLLKV